MDIFNTPYLYAKRYVAKTMLDNDIFVFPRFDADRDDKYQNYIISYPDLVAAIAAAIPGAGVTSVTLNNLNPLFTVANTGTVTDPIFTFTAVPQNANLVYAGPAAGPAAAPTFRALTLADMPAGIDAQDLANVLSVRNLTNEIAMISNNGFSSLSLFDASAILTYTDGNAFATLNLDTANPYLQFYDGASQIGTFGMDYPNQWLVINHTSQVRTTAPIIIEDCTNYGYSFSTPGRILQTNVGTGYVESSIVTVAELDTIGSVAQGVIAGNVYTTDGAGVASWQPLPGSSLAACVTDFYVSNINSCSPLNIQPTNGEDVTLGSVTLIPYNAIKFHIAVNTGSTGSFSTYGGPTDWFRISDGLGAPKLFMGYDANGGYVQSYSTPLLLNPLGNNVAIGFATAPGNIRLSVAGIDATAANYAVNITDNISSSLFAVRNDGYIIFNSNVNFICKPGYNTLFIGSGAGNFTNAFSNDHNIGIGTSSLNSLNGGYQNVAIGTLSFFSTVAGGGNVGVGYLVGANTTGSANAIVGYTSMYSSTTGSGNSYLGANTGYNGNGSFNVFLGYYAGNYETGSNTLIIDNTNRVTEAASRLGALIYGIFDAAVANQRLTINANVGIGGTATGTSTLNISNLPTSFFGLVTGDLWNNLGVLNIIP